MPGGFSRMVAWFNMGYDHHLVMIPNVMDMYRVGQIDILHAPVVQP